MININYRLLAAKAKYLIFHTSFAKQYIYFFKAQVAGFKMMYNTKSVY